MWKDRSAPVIAWVSQSAPAARVRRLAALADEVWTSPGDRVDVQAGLKWLSKRHGVRDALVEGGGSLNDAFFRAGVVDELHLTWCPLLIGGRDAPTACDGLGSGPLAGACRMALHSIQRHGNEIFLVYRASPPDPPGRPLRPTPRHGRSRWISK